MPAALDVRRTDVVLLRAFSHLNMAGAGGCTGVVHLTLGSGDQVTMRAGGPGIHSSPAPPYADYEVLSNAEPKYWRRYSDGENALYVHVPALLVSHFVFRSGGVRDYLFESEVREAVGLMDLKIAVSPALKDTVIAVLSAIAGAELVKATFDPEMS